MQASESSISPEGQLILRIPVPDSPNPASPSHLRAPSLPPNATHVAHSGQLPHDAATASPVSSSQTRPLLSPLNAIGSDSSHSLAQALYHSQQRVLEMQDERRQLQTHLLDNEKTLTRQAQDLAAAKVAHEESTALRSRCVLMCYLDTCSDSRMAWQVSSGQASLQRAVCATSCL